MPARKQATPYLNKKLVIPLARFASQLADLFLNATKTKFEISVIFD